MSLINLSFSRRRSLKMKVCCVDITVNPELGGGLIQMFRPS